MTRADVPALIAYDITDPRRLVRVHKFLKQRAFPVQYSVFVGRPTQAELNAILSGLAVLIDPRSDDVRIYPLPESAVIEYLGRPRLPEGIIAAAGIAERTA